MARHKEFDVEQALDRSMVLFWRQGFRSTSLSDLTREMGISRQSLYDTFGDKKALFTAALDRYREMVAEMVEPLREPDASTAEIRGYFDTILESLTAESEPRSCLMTFTALEQGMADPEVAVRLEGHVGRLQSAFLGAVRNAMDRGEINDRLDPETVARLLTTLVQGISVQLKGGAPPQAVAETVRTALDLLKIG